MSRKKRRRKNTNARLTKPSGTRSVARSGPPSGRRLPSSEEGKDLVKAEFEFRGPLPPPAMLKGYEEVEPGAAIRIIGMAEKLVDHEIAMGHRTSVAAIEANRRGPWFALVTVMAVLGCATYALHIGLEDFAMTLGGRTITGVIALFVLGRLPNWIKSWKGRAG